MIDFDAKLIYANFVTSNFFTNLPQVQVKEIQGDMVV